MPPPAPGAVATPAPPVVAGRVLLERLKATPGVAAAALGNDAPLDGNASADALLGRRSAADDGAERAARYTHRVSPGVLQHAADSARQRPYVHRC